MVKDPHPATPASGGDVLDLRDPLVGENSSNLATTCTSKSGADTVDFYPAPAAYTSGTFVASATDQKIVTRGVDLTNSGALSTGAQIIQDLLAGQTERRLSRGAA